MDFITKNGRGLLLCLVIAVPSWFLGKAFPIIGGAVIAILAGMVVTLFFKEKGAFEAGIKFTSKKILQWAVILLGFGLNLSVILETGRQSLPIIVCTIATSLIIAYILHKAMKIPANISTLVGVGSSICGALPLQLQPLSFRQTMKRSPRQSLSYSSSTCWQLSYFLLSEAPSVLIQPPARPSVSSPAQQSTTLPR